MPLHFRGTLYGISYVILGVSPNRVECLAANLPTVFRTSGDPAALYSTLHEHHTIFASRVAIAFERRIRSTAYPVVDGARKVGASSRHLDVNLFTLSIPFIRDPVWRAWTMTC